MFSVPTLTGFQTLSAFYAHCFVAFGKFYISIKARQSSFDSWPIIAEKTLQGFKNLARSGSWPKRAERQSTAAELCPLANILPKATKKLRKRPCKVFKTLQGLALGPKEPSVKVVADSFAHWPIFAEGDQRIAEKTLQGF
jgi:hypothetical protein